MYSSLRLLFLLVSALIVMPLEAFDRDRLLGWYHSVKDYVDSADIKGADTTYLELPKQGFLGYFQGSLTGTHLYVNYELPETVDGSVMLKGKLNTDVAQLLSLGVTYRGWGFSYSKDLSDHGDTEWAFSTYGQTYGFETRIHTSHTLSGDLDEYFTDNVTLPVLNVGIHAIQQKTWLANFYWVFNHRRFSIPATMSQTVIQRRSSGSFLAILNYHRVNSKVNDPKLSFFIAPAFLPEGGTGKLQFRQLSQTQISLGGGYAYNYVFPNKRLLLHGSMMPMLSLWHHNRTHWDVTEYDNQGDFLGVTAYKSAFSQQLLAFNANMHLNLIYNKDQYVTGLISMLNIDSLPARDRLSIYTFDWSARFFFGIRF